MKKVIYVDSLCHHGIKGMKWGVRKDKETSEHKNQRRKLSDKQKRAIKIGAIAVGSALAIYGAYKLYGRASGSIRTYGVDKPLKNLLNEYDEKDIILRKNSVMQRVSKNAFEDLRGKGHTYVSYKFRDNKRYLSGFRKEINKSGNADFVHKLTAKTELKVASPKTAAKEFLKLYPNASDQTFRMVVNPYSSTGISSINSMRSKLFSSLKSSGYKGLVDIEDAVKRRGAKPLILFNPDSYVSVKNSRAIGAFETVVADILK